VRKISRSPTGRRKPRATSDIIQWPGPDQPVDTGHALMAIAFGNAPILARYLLEEKPVYSGITDLIAFMLDAKVYPKIERDEDGDHPADWCRAWRLEFRRTGRGNRKNYAEVDMKMWKIGLFIEARIQEGIKAEAAKQEAMDAFAISLSQANKALTATRKAFR
jgi:hypothetical protein